MRRFVSLTLILAFCSGIAASAARNDRGIVRMDTTTVPFLKKGDVLFGGTAAGSSYELDDFGMAVVSDVSAMGYRLSFKPDVLFGVSDNLAFGISAVYSRTRLDLESASIGAGDVSLDVMEYRNLEHNYGGALMLRRYLPVGRSGRLALYVDGSLQFTGGEGKMTDRQGDETVGTYGRRYNLSIGVNPGLSVFVSDRLVLSGGLGIAGVGYRWTDQSHNQVWSGERKGVTCSYMLDFLSLSIGLYCCF